MKGMSTVLSCIPLSTGLLLVVHLLTVNCAAQARSEDAWLAVINSGTVPQAGQDGPQARQDQDTEQYQFEQPDGLGVQQPTGRVAQQPLERAAQQPIDIPSKPYDRVPQQQREQQQQQPIERFAQQPVVQQQFQPQLPPQPAPQQRVPQQNPVPREPVRPGQFQRKPQGPPRGLPRPRPGGNRRKPGKPTGIIGGIGDAIGGIVKGAQCTATNLITDEKMKDKQFIRFQLNCAMGRGPCDDIGNKIKILAPEVLAGRCPPPCDECTKKQIRRVMARLSQEFPTEFQVMMRELRG